MPDRKSLNSTSLFVRRVKGEFLKRIMLSTVYKNLTNNLFYNYQYIEGESCSVMSDSLWPHGLYSPWNSPGQNPGVGSLSFLQGIFPTRDRTQFSCIAGGFFTSWATGKSKNTGMDSLSFIQGIFPTQELNQCLLHCTWILYQPEKSWAVDYVLWATLGSLKHL